MTPVFTDPRLEPIRTKVEAQQRLSYDDGVTLYRSPDLLGVGWLANLVRERLHGNRTYFNVNRHINPTDVCVASCKLCAFGKRVRDPKAYTMSLDEVWEKAGHGYTEAVTEFHIVGGLHPELTLDWYCEMLRGLKQRFPQVHLKAFTMVEIGYFATRSKITPREVLIKLKDAGMDSLPGGGAEVFHDRVRRIICDHKITGDQWLEVARTAHQLGLRSNCTMLYGHIETEEDRVDHQKNCAPCRTIQVASRPTFRWRSIPTTRRSITSPRPPVSTTSAPSPSRACCSITSRTSKPTGS
jgi:aminodeoxyfutalosine synthase